MNPSGIEIQDPEVMMLTNNKESAYNYKKRRMDDANENYTLYRGIVKTNRLTQRQSVHIPLMKTALLTNLKDVDDMPMFRFVSRANDKQKEVFLNEHWKETLKINNATLQDIVDKKQNMITGRTFDQWQIINGLVKWSIVSFDDIYVDRNCDPTNIDTARQFIHTHIFVPLSVLEANKDYSREAISKLKEFFGSTMGLVKSSQNEEMYLKKMEKMRDLGDEYATDPILGETLVEITLHFNMHRESEDEEEQYYLYVEAEDMVRLMKKKLEEVIGVTKDHFWRKRLPYESWASDLDIVDFWTDGPADIIREPNKIVDAFFSQIVENRTLSNLNMHVFNSNIENFTPDTWQPGAFRWYPIPVPEGKSINDVYSDLKVQEIGNTQQEIDFLINMIEKATGATSTQQGAQMEKKVTLGEVQLALGEAKERVKGMSKFYTPAWERRAVKYLKLLEAGKDKLAPMTVYRKGRLSDDLYERTIEPKDYLEDAGYSIEVWSQDERNAQNTDSIEKWNAVKANMPDNPKVDLTYKRKLLEFVGADPDESNEIMEFERQKSEAILNQMNMQNGGTDATVPQEGNLAIPKQSPVQMLLQAGQANNGQNQPQQVQ